MATETFEYPASGSVTHSWTPSIEADMNASDETFEDGIIADRSAGDAEVRYDGGFRFNIYRRGFRNLDGNDKADFISFIQTVQGDAIKFTDFLGNAHTVNFDSLRFEFRNQDGPCWNWDVILREAL